MTGLVTLQTEINKHRNLKICIQKYSIRENRQNITLNSNYHKMKDKHRSNFKAVHSS